MKKVILLAPTPPPAGGIAGWTIRMQNTKLGDNWQVEVVDEKLSGNREVFGETKRNYFIEMKRCLRIWKDLIKALSDKNSKIVHCCIPATTFAMLREYISAVITKMYGKKFIIHYRCTIPNQINSKIGLFMFIRLTKISNRVFVLNDQSGKFVKKHANLTPEIIPNFIEKEHIQKSTRKINKKISTVTYVGGVTKAKGCLEIIEIAREFPEITFKLIGNVEKDIKNMKKTKNVILLGEKTKEEVNRELDLTDVFLFLSHFEGEGFSNALAEAMAKGIPCIASDWAANKDMIEDNGGIIVPTKDSKSASNAIKKMMSYEIREQCSQWNIRKIRENYTDEIVTNLYVSQYNSLVGYKYES